MYRKVLDYMEQYHMLEKRRQIIVAFSGGADSVCLLHILTRAAKERDISILAVHIHHGIRGAEADRDANFCREFCEHRNIPIEVRYFDVPAYAKEYGLSLEEAGRLLRYDTFCEIGRERFGEGVWEKQDCPVAVAIAHHRDDQAETILFNLGRGSDLRGLRGMLPVNGGLIRPLLCLGKEEILQYCEEQKLSYCVDSTNAKLDYTRNRIRAEVLPLMQEVINEQASEHLVQLGERMARAEDYLSEMTSRAYAACVTEEKDATGAITRSMLLSHLEAQHEYIAERVIYRAVTTILGRAKDVTAEHVKRVCGLISPNVNAGAIVDVREGLHARKETDGIYLYFAGEDTGEISTRGELRFTVLNWDADQEIINDDYTKYFDYDKLNNSLQLRHREEGDYLILDRAGHHKSLNRYFIDAKVPARLRDRTWVLADGNHVVWVIGGRISEAVKVTEDTRCVLQVEYLRRE